jgi:hypothetical protein
MWTASQSAAYDAWRTSYPKEWDTQQDREDAIDDEVNLLTEDGGDCYPFSVENFTEYLADYATDEQRQALIRLVIDNADKVPTLVKGCEAYWYKEARARAEEIIDSRDDYS